MGDAGLMKLVSLITCRIMPVGNVSESMALLTMFLWCVAWISLKYSLALCLVESSRVCGRSMRGLLDGGGGLDRVIMGKWEPVLVGGW